MPGKLDGGHTLDLHLHCRDMHMPTSHIDHITIVSPTLQAGHAWVQQCLGVHMDQGGKHPRMGTHNLLLRLGDAMFLEVIAVDPDAASPARPRWFGLDRLTPESEPGLACWVAQTTDIAAALSGASEPLGAPEPMTRGALRWQISMPADGSLPLQGVAPALIQWHAAPHPAQSLPEKGCTLEALELQHPQARRVHRLLDSLGVDQPGVDLRVVHAPCPGLIAHIRTAQGLRLLGRGSTAD